MRSRTPIFAALTLVLLYGGIELASAGVYWMSRGKGFSFEQVARKREVILVLERSRGPVGRARDGAEKGRTKVWGWHVIHPYLGFVWDPEHRDDAVNGWILAHDGSNPLLPEDPADAPVDVVLLGGSVTHLLFEDGAGALRDEIAAIPQFAGRRVRIVSIAMPGFKQPQQLLSLAYYLSLGGAADLVVNLDGFNEVGLEMFLVKELGMYPAFPRIWESLVSDFDLEQTRESIEDIAALSRLRRLAAEFFGPVDFSVTGNVLWVLVDDALRVRLDTARTELLEAKSGLERRRVLGFDGSEEAGLDLSRQLWLRGSLALKALADGHGIRYFHFLQPNQYLPGSKPFTSAERNLIKFNYLKRIIPSWYPRLSETGAELVERGVFFRDLSGIFEDVEETLYDDHCCHLNVHGSELLATAIGRAVAEGVATPR